MLLSPRPDGVSCAYVTAPVQYTVLSHLHVVSNATLINWLLMSFTDWPRAARSNELYWVPPSINPGRKEGSCVAVAAPHRVRSSRRGHAYTNAKQTTHILSLDLSSSSSCWNIGRRAFSISVCRWQISLHPSMQVPCHIGPHWMLSARSSLVSLVCVYRCFICQQSYLLFIWYSITHSLFHPRLKTFLFC